MNRYDSIVKELDALNEELNHMNEDGPDAYGEDPEYASDAYWSDVDEILDMIYDLEKELAVLLQDFEDSSL